MYVHSFVCVCVKELVREFVPVCLCVSVGGCARTHAHTHM